MSSLHERRLAIQKKCMEEAAQCEWRGDITMEEVKKHNTKDDLWMVYNGYVYDLTQYVFRHPGGSNCFLNPNSKDMTRAYKAIHPGVDISIYEKLKIGKLVSSE